MNKIKIAKNSVFFTLSAIIFVGSSFPLHAVTITIQQNKQSDSSELERRCVWQGLRRKCPGGASFIWDRFRRRKVPGGSRGENNEKKTCTVTPGRLANIDNREVTTSKVWGDRAFFLWQGSWSQIEVIDVRSGEVMWSQTLDPEQRSILYGEEGKSLQPDRAYEWRLVPAGTSQLQDIPWISFRMMGEDERNWIAVELAVIESGRVLASIERLTAEDTTIARSGYFADRELWSDALRELYSVENPSEELLATIERIERHDFCSSEATSE
ncbi:hypothetical protein IQ249_08050 [Lusitaniella coriacea LEGE 07157]|uniref:Uncharacterized protein n=1 Tax=Lusitaniella coriacea LEGE 07157 TaxID=945747 RepID=A0A8J7DVL7_9CYAN|nr:hypothetical protein [Lusitaniella coriacea]MBE9115842.1 hypothetical protein [Lusitaniella coriacea LEGE 07157]